MGLAQEPCQTGACHLPGIAGLGHQGSARLLGPTGCALAHMLLNLCPSRDPCGYSLGPRAQDRAEVLRVHTDHPQTLGASAPELSQTGSGNRRPGHCHHCPHFTDEKVEANLDFITWVAISSACKHSAPCLPHLPLSHLLLALPHLVALRSRPSWRGAISALCLCCPHCLGS